MTPDEKQTICATLEEAIDYIRSNPDGMDLYPQIYELTELLSQCLAAPEPAKGEEYITALESWVQTLNSSDSQLEDGWEGPFGLPPCQEGRCQLDRQFYQLISSLPQGAAKLSDEMTNEYKKLPNQHQNGIQDYARRYPMWGGVLAKTGRGSLIDERAEVLTAHREDFLWLYNRLCDYRSRHVLNAILRFWRYFDITSLGKVKEPVFADYFDLDLVFCQPGEIVVDMGAYIGDTVFQFANTYPGCCGKMYCYEIDPKNQAQLEANKAKYGWDFMEIRAKAVSDGPGTLFLNSGGSDTSSSKVMKSGTVAVPTVAIDDDIPGPVTLLKMDIEGAEQAALRGSRRHISQERPKLLVCTYHNNEDIWKIPRMIDEMRGDYNFYMRYNGGNLFPTEYVFFAL